MNELIQRQEALYEEIKDFTGCKPAGAARLQNKLFTIVKTGRMKLFVPWAAPANGRTALSEPDKRTLQWNFGANGFRDRMCKFGEVQCMVMFADSYARRNNFDMDAAYEYWQNVSNYISEVPGISYTATSILEDARMSELRAKKAYALDALSPNQQSKILQAALKYSGAQTAIGMYESAAEYSMLRAAEAEYVDTELNALWVSLNWPERDIMCGESPRVYVPEELRAPWLKEY